MKYPITPEYLSSAPDPLVNLFEDLEAEILKDICRRFRITGEATESAIAQIKILQERGADLKEIEKAIRKALGLSEKELDEIFDRAVQRNQEYYDELIYKANVVAAAPKDFSPVLDVIKRQTLGEFVNLTRSLGFAVRTGPTVEFLPIAETYQKILDDAAAQVMSGAFDYNTAVRNAVKRLTESGLQMVDYATGWHDRADVAARRAVMTGVSQLSSQYAEQAAETLHTDYREVTAHRGARDTGVKWQNHKSWQGKVYSVRSGDKYPSIYEACGWGLVDGLEGSNCRHHHFPYIEGISTRTYTDEELANIDPPPFEYQGKQYTAYEATQKQRQIERAMRKVKRDMIGYDAAGLKDDYTDSSIRLRRLSAEYKSFSKAANLREQPERARVAGFGQSHASKATQEANKYYTKWSNEIGANSSIETLAKYYDVKYNDSPRYELLRQYADGVQTGWISPLSGFENYENLYNRIQSGIVGKSTQNGVLITGLRPHFMQRVIGTMVDPKILREDLKVVRRSGVEYSDIEDALFRPEHTGPVATRPSGQRSQRFVGKNCVVTINPDTGQLIQTNLIGG